MTNNEIVRKFAEGAIKGKNDAGSIFIDGERIYSYGYHFVIAERTGAKTANVTKAKRSVTTSGHTTLVRSTLHNYGYTITEVDSIK